MDSRIFFSPIQKWPNKGYGREIGFVVLKVSLGVTIWAVPYILLIAAEPSYWHAVIGYIYSMATLGLMLYGAENWGWR